MDVVCKEDPSRSRKFTVCHRTEELAAFDTPEEVVKFVSRRLERSGYTIYLGAGVSSNSLEVKKITKEWPRR